MPQYVHKDTTLAASTPEEIPCLQQPTADMIQQFRIRNMHMERRNRLEDIRAAISANIERLQAQIALQRVRNNMLVEEQGE